MHMSAAAADADAEVVLHVIALQPTATTTTTAATTNTTMNNAGIVETKIITTSPSDVVITHKTNVEPVVFSSILITIEMNDATLFFQN
jgi:hypothetical protein